MPAFQKHGGQVSRSVWEARTFPGDVHRRDPQGAVRARGVSSSDFVVHSSLDASEVLPVRHKTEEALADVHSEPMLEPAFNRTAKIKRAMGRLDDEGLLPRPLKFLALPPQVTTNSSLIPHGVGIPKLPHLPKELHGQRKSEELSSSHVKRLVGNCRLDVKSVSTPGQAHAGVRTSERALPTQCLQHTLIEIMGDRGRRLLQLKAVPSTSGHQGEQSRLLLQGHGELRDGVDLRLRLEGALVLQGLVRLVVHRDEHTQELVHSDLLVRSWPRERSTGSVHGTVKPTVFLWPIFWPVSSSKRSLSHMDCCCSALEFVTTRQSSKKFPTKDLGKMLHCRLTETAMIKDTRLTLLASPCLNAFVDVQKGPMRGPSLNAVCRARFNRASACDQWQGNPACCSNAKVIAQGSRSKHFSLSRR